ncbi:MAG: hypothetical protein GX757_08460 [Clostridiales bacterium]|nr:hypothetical protein [Clostridiales bacterium]
MVAFIKNYSLSVIKKKFILLYFLNVTDIIFTVLLLQTGYFQEANILMAKALNNPLVSLLLKIILPAVLLIYIYKQIKDADSEQLRASNIAVNISLTIYTLVNLSHLVWTVLLFVIFLQR